MIGLAWGQNPCEDEVYLKLLESIRNYSHEDLAEEEKNNWTKLNSECLEFERVLAEYEKWIGDENRIEKVGFFFNKEDYQFFLENKKKLKLVGDNYELIKSELDKMLDEYKSLFDLDNYFKEQYTEKVYKGSHFNEDAYLTALLSMNNPNQSEANFLKTAYTKPVYKYVAKEKNRIIQYHDTLFTKMAEWEEIISYYGGYSQLSRNGITKDDINKYNVSAVLEKIELTDDKTCLAHVKIEGSNDAMKFHKIPKSAYKYKGSYNINYGSNYSLLYKDNQAWLEMTFDEKTYLPISHTKIKYSIDEKLLPSNDIYKQTIRTMFDDLVPNSFGIIVENSQEYEVFKNLYIDAYGLWLYNYNISEAMKTNEAELDLFSWYEEKPSNDKISEENQRYNREKQENFLCYGLAGIAYFILALIHYSA